MRQSENPPRGIPVPGLVLAIVLACGTAAAQAPPLCGDCNGDGIVSILDALVAAQHNVGLLTIVSPEFELCDVEADFGDGDIDVLDALRLAQINVGLVPIALCTPASSPLDILSVSGPICVGSGQTVRVSMDVRNPNPDAANVTGEALTFEAPGGVDVTGEYIVAADPGNPPVLGAGVTSSFGFTVIAPVSPTAGPIVVDGAVTGIDSVTGVSVDAAGAASPLMWVIALLSTDFESGPSFFTGSGDWEYGMPTNPAVPTKPGFTVWGTDLNGNYSNSTLSSLTSPPIDLRMTVAADLEFSMWHQIEGPDWDGCNVKASIDGGVTYNLLLPLQTPYNGTIRAGTPNPLAGQTGWLDTIPDWVPVTLDLAPVLGNIVSFRFDFGADNFVTDIGWYIDDIVICDASALPPGAATNPNPPNGATDVIAFPAGGTLSWDAAPLAANYDVYFDTVSPPVAQITAMLPGTSTGTPGLAPSTTYYWRVDSRNPIGLTPGSEWSFTTGTLTSVPEVFINELETRTPDYVEIVNASMVPVNISGWTLEIHGSDTPDGTFVFPTGITLDPGGYVVVADAAVQPGYRYDAGFNFAWDTTVTGEAILRTDAGVGVDYVSCNLATFPNLPGDLSWAGMLGMAGLGNVSRTNFFDTDVAGDFTPENRATPRNKNPAQPFTLPSPSPFAPFPADGATNVRITPSGTGMSWDVNGQWDTFDIYIDPVSPPTTMVAAGLTAPRLDSDVLAPGTTYYWRIHATNAAGTTIGDEFSFTTAATVALPAILLNECQTGTPDFVEIFNAETTPVDISGWEMSIYSSGTPGGFDGTFVFPGGTMMPGQSFLTIYDGTGPPPTPGFRTPFNINWVAAAVGEVLLAGPGGALGVDYVAFNTTMPGYVPGDLAFTAATALDINGQGVAARIDFIDTDDVSDWQALGGTTPGGENPGQPPVSVPGVPSAPQPANGATQVLARVTGHRLVWQGAGTTADFEVFFDTVSPPVASLGIVVEETILSTALTPGTTYFWRVEARNMIGTVMGPIWSFTTGTLGTAPIIINEMNAGNMDFVEILNVSGGPVDVNGWSVEFYDDGVLDGIYTMAGWPMVGPTNYPVISESGAITTFVTGFNITWATTNGMSECILRDALGVCMDYGWCRAGGAPPPSRRPGSTAIFADSDPQVTGGNPSSWRTFRGDDDRTSDFGQGAASPGSPNPGQ